MTLATRHLTFTFSAAGVAMLGLAAVVTIRADQTVVMGGGAQVETRVVMEGARIGGPGLAAPPTMPMAPGTGLIFGQATEGTATRPVAGALVTLNLPGVIPLRVLADGQGRFVFRDLPKGSFTITATKGGYVDGAYGRMRPQGQSQSIDLGEGERLSNVNVALWKFGAIAGQLLDESGEPMIGTTVRVLKKTIAGGKPRLALGATDQTDDHGFYRIGMLEPGEYIVCVPMTQQNALTSAFESIARTGSGGMGQVIAALPAAGLGLSSSGPITLNLDDSGSMTVGTGPDGRPLAYTTVFYPSAASASRATVVPVGSGEERTGLDLQLRLARTARVSGTVIAPTGPSGNLTLTLVPIEADELVSPIETATALSTATGSFTFPAVTPGQYILRVLRMPRMAGGGETFSFSSSGDRMTFTTRTVTTTVGGPAPALPANPTLWAEIPVSVNAADVSGLALSLRTGLKVSGQLEWIGMAEKPTSDRWPNIGMSLEPADARTAGLTSAVRGRIETSGAFATMGAVPGRYFVRATGVPQGWYFQGATSGGRDVTDLPIDLESADVAGVTLTFTDKRTELTGTVTNSNGVNDATAAVIVFPAERDQWSGYGTSPRRLRNVRTDPKGAYTVQGLPPGRYYVAAVRDALAAEWQDPKFLDALAGGATTVSLGEGQKSTQSLKVVR